MQKLHSLFSYLALSTVNYSLTNSVYDEIISVFSLSIYQCVFVCMCCVLYVCMFVYVCMHCGCNSMRVYVYLSVSLCVCTCGYVYLCLYASWLCECVLCSVCVSVLSAIMSVCLSVCVHARMRLCDSVC